jgi:uncharacterized protein YeaO (DUF488 family)
MINFVYKRDSFFFFFKTSKYETKFSQRFEENLNKSLNNTIEEIDNASKIANLLAINSKTRNENLAINNSLNYNKT